MPSVIFVFRPPNFELDCSTGSVPWIAALRAPGFLVPRGGATLDDDTRLGYDGDLDLLGIVFDSWHSTRSGTC